MEGGDDYKTKDAAKRFSSYWSEDPAHMNRNGYNMMAK
jgi:hypothetical protein